MNDDEVQSELAQDGAQTLLETAALARLAYNGLDAQPRVIPTGFFWTGSAVVFCTAVPSPKVRALAQRPQVAVTIDVGGTPADARSLLLRGTVTLETVDGIPAEYLAAAHKTMSEEEVAGFEQQVQTMYPQMVRISLVPRWARYYDFGAGRLPAFLQRLADNA
ncbi:pyridoxamine 5'-phosphate oxidase family protein [Subtercola sp. YIM 133946]|uniref:pyridoxamine 5'-phosphate oxidase family protein n=1 Tax=Subtercola sp. YIM 133946 TaxID=3118909 RepID=UPI002F94D244